MFFPRRVIGSSVEPEERQAKTWQRTEEETEFDSQRNFQQLAESHDRSRRKQKNKSVWCGTGSTWSDFPKGAIKLEAASEEIYTFRLRSREHIEGEKSILGNECRGIRGRDWLRSSKEFKKPLS